MSETTPSDRDIPPIRPRSYVTSIIVLNGVLRLLESRHPRLARQAQQWAQDVSAEFERRASREGREPALLWLEEQARNPKIDLRAGKSLDRDREALRLFAALQIELAPLFRASVSRTRRSRLSRDERSRAAARVVKNITGQRRSFTSLNLERLDLPRACWAVVSEVTGMTPKTFHRAALRVRHATRKYLTQLFEDLEGNVGDTRAYVAADPTARPEHILAYLRGLDDIIRSVATPQRQDL